jgi:beta-galactosidase
MLPRLSLTHRSFNVVELSRDPLDATEMPICWVMMERQCDGGTQQKLADYLHAGGKLILAGRMCSEKFNHEECTILKDAIGIAQIKEDLPLVSVDISVFNYHDVPVSFVETYSGEFDEVFATLDNGEVVGFVKKVGKGKVIVLGAAMSVETLGDLDVVDQMAIKMDCQSHFKLSRWADVRISYGENGSFLFINNYQDDPVETKIEYEDKDLFGGNPVVLLPRRGLILPIDWQLSKDVLIHYVTSEIREITDDGRNILLKTEPNEFFAEITLSGYRCDQAVVIQETAGKERVRLHGKEGVILLRKV